MPRQVSFRSLLHDPLQLIAFGLGSGLLPRAPGTWGSALAWLAFWLLPPLSPLPLGAAIAAAFLLGIWLCGESAKRLGTHDHPGIVFDEMVAMWAVLAVTPRLVVWQAVAFLLFRAMDIWKPWPIREADHRIPGGLGIMLDDVLAAAYAAALLLGLREASALLT